MLHVISARCFACDLHTIAPGPLERMRTVRGAVRRLQKHLYWRFSVRLLLSKISIGAFQCDYYCHESTIIPPLHPCSALSPIHHHCTMPPTAPPRCRPPPPDRLSITTPLHEVPAQRPYLNAQTAGDTHTTGGMRKPPPPPPPPFLSQYTSHICTHCLNTVIRLYQLGQRRSNNQDMKHSRSHSQPHTTYHDQSAGDRALTRPPTQTSWHWVEATTLATIDEGR